MWGKLLSLDLASPFLTLCAKARQVLSLIIYDAIFLLLPYTGQILHRRFARARSERVADQT